MLQSQQLLHELLSSCTSPSPCRLSECAAVQSVQSTTITGSFTPPVFSYKGKVTTCCPPLLHWRMDVLWSSSSFNITIFSFLLCCASGCWVFTVFLPSRLFRLIIDNILDPLQIQYFFICRTPFFLEVKGINVSRCTQYSALNFWEN